MDRDFLKSINKADFDVTTPEAEVRVDHLCQDLLMQFYQQLLEEGVEPAQATGYAGSADYYLRDYLVSIRGGNLFHPQPGMIRQFAGNWYIVSTMEPNAPEVGRHLDGIREFYRFLCRSGLIDSEFLAKVELECADLDYYCKRIESFWNITGDGYGGWERECSLKN